jgi:lysosomal Pro-X carboxypeptidase
VFFYAGNEGGIENFYSNSGFVTETLAMEFGAAVIFAEHRFFGDSMPGGNVTAAAVPEIYKHLTAEQAQQDYVNLINYMKNPAKDDINKANFLKLDLAKRPIIAVGGSYGGMLAAWLRMKYPHVFAGALASSAPLVFSPEKVSPFAFSEAITNVYKAQNLLCPTFIKMHLLSLQKSA